MPLRSEAEDNRDGREAEHCGARTSQAPPKKGQLFERDQGGESQHPEEIDVSDDGHKEH